MKKPATLEGKPDRIRPVPEMYKWYQVVSSGIKWYQVVSSGIKWYQVVSSGIKWYQVVSSGIKEAEVSSGRQVIFPKPIFSHRVEHQMDSNGGRVRQLSGHSHGMKLKDAVL